MGRKNRQNRRNEKRAEEEEEKVETYRETYKVRDFPRNPVPQADTRLQSLYRYLNFNSFRVHQQCAQLSVQGQPLNLLPPRDIPNSFPPDLMLRNYQLHDQLVQENMDAANLPMMFRAAESLRKPIYNKNSEDYKELIDRMSPIPPGHIPAPLCLNAPKPPPIHPKRYIPCKQPGEQKRLLMLYTLMYTSRDLMEILEEYVERKMRGDSEDVEDSEETVEDEHLDDVRRENQQLKKELEELRKKSAAEHKKLTKQINKLEREKKEDAELFRQHVERHVIDRKMMETNLKNMTLNLDYIDELATIWCNYSTRLLQYIHSCCEMNTPTPDDVLAPETLEFMVQYSLTRTIYHEVNVVANPWLWSVELQQSNTRTVPEPISNGQDFYAFQMAARHGAKGTWPRFDRLQLDEQHMWKILTVQVHTEHTYQVLSGWITTKNMTRMLKERRQQTSAELEKMAKALKTTLLTNTTGLGSDGAPPPPLPPPPPRRRGGRGGRGRGAK